jgi:hypothetical protein
MNATPLSSSHKALIRALIYPIQFSKTPGDEVERVARDVLPHAGAKASPQEYATAINAALSSPEHLSKLLPQPHSEETVREYLAKLEACFEP